jgi:hypothetical protein
MGTRSNQLNIIQVSERALIADYTVNIPRIVHLSDISFFPLGKTTTQSVPKTKIKEDSLSGDIWFQFSHITITVFLAQR